ncbi:MAG: hypothetical protein QM784_37595 [Polyangiaceae bacterium]
MMASRDVALRGLDVDDGGVLPGHAEVGACQLNGAHARLDATAPRSKAAHGRQVMSDVPGSPETSTTQGRAGIVSMQ